MSDRFNYEQPPLEWDQRHAGQVTHVSAELFTNTAVLNRDAIDGVIFPGYGEKRRTAGKILEVCTEHDFAAAIILPDDRAIPSEFAQINALVHEFGAETVNQLKERKLIVGNSAPYGIGHSLGGLVLAKTFTEEPLAFGDSSLLQPIGADRLVRELSVDNEKRRARKFRHDFYTVLGTQRLDTWTDGFISSREVLSQVVYDKFSRRFKTKFGVAAYQAIVPDIALHLRDGNRVQLRTGDGDPLCGSDDVDRSLFGDPEIKAGLERIYQPKGHTHMAWKSGRLMTAETIDWLQSDEQIKAA